MLDDIKLSYQIKYTVVFTMLILIVEGVELEVNIIGKKIIWKFEFGAIYF